MLVLGIARHSETEEKLVAYVPLGVRTGPRITVRPYGMFFSDVRINGKEMKRFTFMGEEVSAEIAKQYDTLGGYTGKDRVDD